jgi:glycosyltransferase involved in cell wall biosynthesis
MGGAQARFCAVANHHGRALRHAIVTMDGNVSCRAQLRPGLDVVFPDVQVRSGDTLGNLRRFRAVLRDLRPDVLLTHNFGSIEWALASLLAGLGTRHVHVEDGFGADERDRQSPRRVWLRRLALRRATVALPSRVLMRLAQTVWRLDERRLYYVPNGVDLRRFGPRPAGALSSALPWVLPWVSDGGGPVVGTVAALRPEKNLARLIQAVARVLDLRLIVVGDGPERTALTALVGALGLERRVALVGPMADPAAAYAHMDMFALSSDTEQMPLSVLEAMAAGLPVAATDVGDITQMLAVENRDFVVARDDAALAGALARLVGDVGLRRDVGLANRARAESAYGQARMFDAWGALLGAHAEAAHLPAIAAYPTRGANPDMRVQEG